MSNAFRKKLEAAIDRLASLFDQARQWETRTHKYLYRAIGNAYRLERQMQTDESLRAVFDEVLKARGLPKGKNEALSLVKLTFCPNLPDVGTQERKNELNKASSYAKLINKALAAEINPSEFADFARQVGVQRTAGGAAPAKTSSEPGNSTSLKPIGARIGISSLAVYRAVCRALSDAGEAQDVQLRLSASKGRAVIVGVTTRSLKGVRPFPSARYFRRKL
jgi:hypothetical protein